ncbi:spore germination protein KB [Paenibacillus uliginis N3/975]|uniref:Spore germination protein KB n=1 Tax=Paenibacillus uliginis N3/975 TaxID=1313296 RepID=A0A1X7H8A5_9BACL|nr:endospore germination permease [Paenibacillus uliginis]SMF80586.1 spore germination protein KB [Paenibacillus uliginis N3/975]
MQEPVKISARQFTILTIFFSIGSAILVIPSSVAYIAKQDAWIASLIGVACGLCLTVLYNILAGLYPQMNLIQIMEKALGKWLGKVLSLLIIITLIIIVPGVLHYVGNFLTTQIMPETPVQAVNILFAIVVVMGVRLGLETLARSAELMFPWFILLYVSLVVLVASQIKLENVQPVFERGVGPIWPAVLSFVSLVFLPHFLMLMIHSSSVNQPREARKAFLLGSLIGGLVIALIVALSILVFGPEIISHSFFPSYLLAQKINIGNFLQRIEVIMAIMWFISLYFRLTLYLYFMALALTYIFNLSDYRPLVLPLGILLVAISVIVYPNVAYQQNFDSRIWVPYILTIGLLLPLLLLLIHGLRKLAGNKKKK